MIRTEGRELDDVLKELARLYMELQRLHNRLAPLLWLEKQEIINTPELLWINDGGQTLAEKIEEVIALRGLR